MVPASCVKAVKISDCGDVASSPCRWKRRRGRKRGAKGKEVVATPLRQSTLYEMVAQKEDRTRSSSLTYLEASSQTPTFKVEEAWAVEHISLQSVAFSRFSTLERLSIVVNRGNVAEYGYELAPEVEFDECEEDCSDFVTSDEEADNAYDENKASDRDGCWAIERILAKKRAPYPKSHKGTIETSYYYIKWSGWSHCFDNWVFKKNLNRVGVILKEYEAREELLSCVVQNPEFRVRDENLRQLRNLDRWEAEINKVLEGTRIPQLYVYNDRNSNLRPEGFKYVLKNVLPKDMQVAVNAPAESVCSCNEGACGSNDRCCLARIGRGFFYTTAGHLRIDYSHESGPLLECCDQCGCGSKCRAKVVQRGRKRKVAIVQTEKCGWGVFALEDISANRFVVEYVGEVLTYKDAKERPNTLYQFEVGEDGPIRYVIDAQYFGNESAFINHSCKPNLVAIPVYVERGLSNFHRVAFFSAEDIKRGQELTLDYFNNPLKEYIHDTDGIKCHCGAEGCRGYFPQLMCDESPEKTETKKRSNTPSRENEKEVVEQETESAKPPTVKRLDLGGT